VAVALFTKSSALAVVLDDFAHEPFTITGSATQTVYFDTDFGSVRADYSVSIASATMAGGKLTFYGNSPGGAYLNLLYRFATPISLAAFSHLDLQFQHPATSYTPIDRIVIGLESGAIVERRNYTSQPIGVTQSRFPFYDFEDSSNWQIHALDRVVYVAFSLTKSYQQPDDVIEFEELAVIAGPPVVKPEVYVYRDSILPNRFFMATKEAIGTNQVFCIDVSSDAVVWHKQFTWERGAGRPFVRQVYPDFRFRRMRVFNYVP